MIYMSECRKVRKNVLQSSSARGGEAHKECNQPAHTSLRSSFYPYAPPGTLKLTEPTVIMMVLAERLGVDAEWEQLRALQCVQLSTAVRVDFI
jgi:hypothetical protein